MTVALLRAQGACAVPLRRQGRAAALHNRHTGPNRTKCAPPRCIQGNDPKDKAEPPSRKKSVEELAGRQLSGTDPGGELGALDPQGPKQGGQPQQSQPNFQGPYCELEIDPGLRELLMPLVLSTRARLQARQASLDPPAVGQAAVAAAEASGALPPLAGPQRAAVESFFTRLAGMWIVAKGSGRMGSSGGGYGDEDAMLRIRPHQRELMEAVINAHLGSGGSPRRSTSPRDSVKSGGEVGNIALQSDTRHTSTEAPKGMPAQSEADRAELQAEAAFEQMELMDLPHPQTADFEAQRDWERRHPGEMDASSAIEGDAPAAGGGLQVLDSEIEERQIGGSEDASS